MSLAMNEGGSTLTKLTLAISDMMTECQSMLTCLLRLVLAILQPSYDLSVYKVCADAVQVAVMPGGEDLFAEVETPGGMLFLPPLPPHLLLTL